MKWKRVNQFYITLQYEEFTFEVFKDYGSMGRSKPYYGIILNDKVIDHGFTTQREAKKSVERIIAVKRITKE